MPRPMGYSTGALAKGDFRLAMDKMRGHGLTAIELSALRSRELLPLFAALADLDLRRFAYVAIHLPVPVDARAEARDLAAVQAHGVKFPLIVHPDVLHDFEAWNRLGSQVCVENMDSRKPLGRTAAEMAAVFEKLPQASFCLDLGHVRQVDPSMNEARQMLRQFGQRLRQLHVSTVTARGEHRPMDEDAALAFQRVAAEVGSSVPIILESPVGTAEELASQLALAEEVFGATSAV